MDDRLRFEVFSLRQEMTWTRVGQYIATKPDFQAISYYSRLKADPNKALDDVDPNC
jgi:hypothetical protein